MLFGGSPYSTVPYSGLDGAISIELEPEPASLGFEASVAVVELGDININLRHTVLTGAGFVEIFPDRSANYSLETSVENIEIIQSNVLIELTPAEVALEATIFLVTQPIAMTPDIADVGLEARLGAVLINHIPVKVHIEC